MCKSYAARQTSAECSAGSTERTDTGEPTAAAAHPYLIAQCGCSEEREETKEPHSKGDLETSTAFHKQPKAFRICFQMNKPDFF